MPSIQNQINGHTVANDIRMMRTSHNGSFLIVEGDTDFRFYSQFIDSDKCEITVAIEDENVIQAICILEKSGFKGVLGIIDADFRHLERKKPKTKNIVMTDTHDIETMIMKSPGFDGVVCEYCDPTKLKRFTKGKDLRDILINQTKLIGYLRWYSKRNNLGLKFKELDFLIFINTNNLHVSLDKLITAVINNTYNCSLTRRTLKMGIQSLMKKRVDCWQVCQGHDMATLLLIGLKNIFGSRNVRQLHRGSLEGGLRLAYNRDNFFKTKICNQILSWEKANPSYIILNLTI